MAKQKPGVKRFAGRWVREGEQHRDRRRLLRAVLGRFWYLLVPFLGIMCANDTHVRPDLEDMKNARNLELKDVLDRKDDLRAQTAAVYGEVVGVQDMVDTLYAPRIEMFAAIRDSLGETRAVYDETLPETRARIDSLEAVSGELLAEVDHASSTYRRRSATLDSLVAWQAALDDSIVALDEQIAMRTDHLYRLRHPREYQRKDALFIGTGEYPRRDENPSRERGQ
ncbi:MAG: hypothetical protein FJY75_02140 [Candidatus Eisenbacteria bacterium]|uniref:Uncharacterized protein n=1 Tax=Eiseniibacteriota bacterium TaxID=2212470 RepID=A0A937X9P8_UNCEI|nr:hypothetical protein [Candidatus Eisenbacteria bacterium]